MLLGAVLLRKPQLQFTLTVIGLSVLDLGGDTLITDMAMDTLTTDTDGDTHIMDTDIPVTVGDTQDMVVAIQDMAMV
jgi:hypothetical protein